MGAQRALPCSRPSPQPSPSRERSPASRWRLEGAAALLRAGHVGMAVVRASKQATGAEPLPKIGPAPDFTLTNQEGKRVSLTDLRGEVTVVTFIFTSCSDTCPMLTAKLVGIQRRLGTGRAKSCIRCNHGRSVERHAAGAEEIRAGPFREPRHLLVPHRIVQGDRGRHSRICRLLEEAARRECGSYIPDFDRRPKRHAARAVSGQFVSIPRNSRPI